LPIMVFDAQEVINQGVVGRFLTGDAFCWRGSWPVLAPQAIDVRS